MRVTVLAFHPESVDRAIEQLEALYPDQQFDLEYVYPSIAFSDADVLDEELRAGIEARFADLELELRYLHCAPAEFLSALFQGQPPALVVVAYRFYSERVALTTNMLLMRRFPTLLIGYDE
ncbi:MAG: hypothetical protein D6761_11820 [Candidatus Dadabacteria bacterium]|nr:MAG: hypothetical protein D6761_11820 [Candidatus Dadabacteria bacterium]